MCDPADELDMAGCGHETGDMLASAASMSSSFPSSVSGLSTESVPLSKGTDRVPLRRLSKITLSQGSDSAQRRTIHKKDIVYTQRLGLFVDFVTQSERAFTMIDNERFQKFVQALDQRWQMPCKAMITGSECLLLRCICCFVICVICHVMCVELIPRRAMEVSSRIKAILAEASCISLGSHVWTAHHTSFIGLTAFAMIPRQGGMELHEFTLGLGSVPSMHARDPILAVLKSILKRFLPDGIKDSRLECITTDSADMLEV